MYVAIPHDDKAKRRRAVRLMQEAIHVRSAEVILEKARRGHEEICQSLQAHCCPAELPEVTEGDIADVRRRMFSGWGIRTMAQGEGAYNPIGYHVGTVWPHDNSIIAAGLWRYGYREEASRLTEAMIEASTYFDARLPEAFAGYAREYTLYPAEYPTACSPQAWATGTPLLMIRVILGLQPEGAQLLVDPYLPEKVGQLSVAGIPGRWGRMDVSADATDTLVDALEAVSREAPPAVRELFAAIDRADLPATKAGSSAHASVGFRVGDAGDWLIAVDDGHVRVREGFDTADCVLEASEPVLVSILRGEQNARTAIMSGKVKVTGDIEIAQKLGRLTR